jgi:hypothetical protein
MEYAEYVEYAESADFIYNAYSLNTTYSAYSACCMTHDAQNRAFLDTLRLKKSNTTQGFIYFTLLY